MTAIVSIKRRIGRYDIDVEIGHGGMATVYRARDTVLDRDVALKVLHPHLAVDDALVARLFAAYNFDAVAHLAAQAQNLDLLAEELRLAQNALNAITGEFTSDDLLGVIFSSFCIGK